MGMKYTDEDLIRCLTKFIRGMPIQYHDIPYINLYGNKESAELFQNSGNDHVNYFFTQLKRKTIKGKNFNRSIVGGCKRKGRDNSKEILDKERSRIGYKKTFRFNEESTEYCLDKTTIDVLRERGEIIHEDSVVCFITKKLPSLDEPFKALTDEELEYFDTPEYPHAYRAN
ncbi:hypothetical protein R3W88_011518 [Solanum pinnatisectum]|uniref:NAC domain-containing protein n=1 Tax=Solanum pinnatisectum TaxID=50273 RepID=A0AAV9L6E3_9SOLN|nr:hypothetical protein R3W88_011518 [Solanum pinnatisectum]